MKTGDKVRAIELMQFDESCGLEIGDTGTIQNGYLANDGSELDVFEIKFDKDITSDRLNEDGTYDMYRFQLEVIGEEE